MKINKMNTYVTRSIHLSPSKKRHTITFKNIKDSLPIYTIKNQNNNTATFTSLIKSLNNQNYTQALNDLSFNSQSFPSQMHFSAFHYLLLLMTNSFDKISNGLSLAFSSKNCIKNMEITPHVKLLITSLVIPIARNAENTLIALLIPQTESFTDIDTIHTIFTHSHSLIVYILTLSMLHIQKEDYPAQLIDCIVTQLLRQVCNECNQCIFVNKIIKKITETAKLSKRSNPRLTIRIKNNCLSAKKLLKECQMTKLKTESDFSSFQKYMEIASNNKYQQYPQNQGNDSLISNCKLSFINCSKLSNDTKKKVCNTSTQDKSYEMFRVVKPKKLNYKRITQMKISSVIRSSSGKKETNGFEKHYNALQSHLQSFENALEEFKAETDYIKSQLDDHRK